MADEQTNEGIPAISLPAGSFELRDLLKGLDGATSVKNRELHPERITSAIVAAASETTKEVLANADRTALPLGAVMVKTEQVIRDGDDPVDREVMAFEGVDAESGEDASKMAYRKSDERVIAVAANEPVVAAETDQPVTLASEAAVAIEGDTSDAKATSTGKSSSK